MNKALEELLPQLSESITEEKLCELLAMLDARDDIVIPNDLTHEDDNNEDEAKSKSLNSIIAGLTLPQKIKLSMRGNKATRTILLRDKNHLVPKFVLGNPQITEDEIAELARNPNTNEEVLRIIANNSKWMRGYMVKLSIVSNPKVPLDISTKWVKFLKDRDLRQLSRSKNIPQVLATLCMRTAAIREK